MKRFSLSSRFNKLLDNSRFWILAIGITLSILLIGVIQLYVPAGSLQTIRIEQTFGFISLLLLYVAILASPLTKVFPNLKFKPQYLHARRAIGVMAFYYAFLHVWITFFQQLDGFGGIKYYDARYKNSLLLGVFGLAILFIMAATSLDWAVKTMHFKNWKLLHRLVYFASVAILLHIIILGPHYMHLSLLGIVTYVAIGILVILEGIRIYNVMRARNRKSPKKAV